jgi:hypothetical protein
MRVLEREIDPDLSVVAVPVNEIDARGNPILWAHDIPIVAKGNLSETLAPFLTFDRDPYIVADLDHYSYIIDAYTTSQNYPYSESRSLVSWPK